VSFALRRIGIRSKTQRFPFHGIHIHRVFAVLFGGVVAAILLSYDEQREMVSFNSEPCILHQLEYSLSPFDPVHIDHGLRHRTTIG
jgi:hypothetical protein